MDGNRFKDAYPNETKTTGRNGTKDSEWSQIRCFYQQNLQILNVSHPNSPPLKNLFMLANIPLYNEIYNPGFTYSFSSNKSTFFELIIICDFLTIPFQPSRCILQLI